MIVTMDVSCDSYHCRLTRQGAVTFRNRISSGKVLAHMHTHRASKTIANRYARTVILSAI